MANLVLQATQGSRLWEDDGLWTPAGSENGAVTNWTIGDKVILSVIVWGGSACNKVTDAGTLRLRFSEDSGAWTDLGASTAIAYTTTSTTTLTDGATVSGQTISSDTPLVDCTTGYGLYGKVEKGDGIFASFAIGAIENWTEVWIVLDTSNANAGSTYEFALYNTTTSAYLTYDDLGVGNEAVLTTLTMSAGPSSTPSSTPSASPSVSPSGSPSVSPSGSPSVSISGSPSVSISGSPSVSPSGSPSVSESVSPSGSPSVSPSVSPSASPSSIFLDPTVVLNTPTNGATGQSLTPTVEFTGTETHSLPVEYNVQVMQEGTPVTQWFYDSSNVDNWNTPATGGNTRGGQIMPSMAPPGGTTIITSAKVWAYRNGTPTVDAYVEIWEYGSGTVGVDAIPPNNISGRIGLSDPVDISTISTSPSWVEFIFDPPIVLDDAPYGFTLWSPESTATNGIKVGRDDSSPTATGNNIWSAESPAWNYSNTIAVIFDVIGYDISAPDIDADSTTDVGFANVDTPANTHPFNSGDKCDYDVQVGDTLNSFTDYVWRVRAKAPSGTNVWGEWTSLSTFTTGEGPSPSTSPSSSPSGSPSVSISGSPSGSPSVSISGSPSVSPSVSISGSPSGSPSVSPSGSPSVSESGSPSGSPSVSESGSPSVSPSTSPSVSSTPSVSPSTSPSVSSTPSTSPSASPSPGYEYYTRGVYASLPTGTADLTTAYSAQDYLDVDADDASLVGVTGSSGDYIIHQFRDWVGSDTSILLQWKGNSEEAPSSSTVYLQIYNENTLTWDTVDTENAVGVGVDFMLSNYVTTANYINNGTITCRVYQQIL